MNRCRRYCHEKSKSEIIHDGCLILLALLNVVLAVGFFGYDKISDILDEDDDSRRRNWIVIGIICGIIYGLLEICLVTTRFVYIFGIKLEKYIILRTAVVVPAQIITSVVVSVVYDDIMFNIVTYGITMYALSAIYIIAFHLLLIWLAVYAVYKKIIKACTKPKWIQQELPSDPEI